MRNIEVPIAVKVKITYDITNIGNGRLGISKKHGVDEWAEAHSVVKYSKNSKGENGYVSVVFDDPSDYSLFALTWDGNPFNFVYN